MPHVEDQEPTSGALGVCVVVAAYNCERTIARAVASALAEPDVQEVIVADDASTDGTLAAAREADDGSGRLIVVSMPANGGPGAARNAAMGRSMSPVICVLDSDDYFLPGRISALLQLMPGHDFVADDIVIVPEALDRAEVTILPNVRPAVVSLDLAQFVAGNVPRHDRSRGELGFLKPLMRRSFLDENALRYEPGLRLGEDYALYVKALMAGARFVVAPASGYVAIERPQSISGQHTWQDRQAIVEFDDEMLAGSNLSIAERGCLSAHRDWNRSAAVHGRALELRRSTGWSAALTCLARAPSALPFVAKETFRQRSRAIRVAIFGAPIEESASRVRRLLDLPGSDVTWTLGDGGAVPQPAPTAQPVAAGEVIVLTQSLSERPAERRLASAVSEGAGNELLSSSPDVSFIIAAYNVAPFIEEAVQSALAQIGVSVEVIVVDDASTDATASVVRRLRAQDERVILVEHQKNAGPAVARDAAIKIARGAWLAILDGDDFVTPERSRHLINLAAATGVELIADNFERVDQAGRPLGITLIPVGLQPYSFFVDLPAFVSGNALFSAKRPLGALKAMVRHDFIRAHALTHPVGLPNGEDFLFILRCQLAGGQLAISSQSHYKYRQRAGSQSWRLTEDDVVKLIAAFSSHDLRGARPGCRETLAAARKYEAALDRARVLTAIVGQAKAGRWTNAVRCALRSPAAWPLVGMSAVGAVQNRLVSSSTGLAQ